MSDETKEVETTEVQEVVTRKALAKSVAELYEITASLAERIIDTVFDEVSESVQMGKVVYIPGFGKFKPVTRAARVARNPQTGESIDVAEKTAIKFKPSATIKKALNE